MRLTLLLSFTVFAMPLHGRVITSMQARLSVCLCVCVGDYVVLCFNVRFLQVVKIFFFCDFLVNVARYLVFELVVWLTA